MDIGRIASTLEPCMAFTMLVLPGRNLGLDLDLDSELRYSTPITNLWKKENEMVYDDTQKTLVRNQLLARVSSFIVGKPMSSGDFVFTGLNPFRDDKSLGSYHIDSRGRCHDYSDGTSHDLIDAYAHVKGMSFTEVMESFGQLIEESPSPIPSVPATPTATKGGDPNEPDQRVWVGNLPTITGVDAVYHYYNRYNFYIGSTVRVPKEGVNSKGKPKKEFRIITSDGEKLVYKAVGWKRKPIYNLQNLDRQNILIVEGEKSADAAQKVLGDSWCVLAWACGTASVLSPDWSVVAETGKPIYLWPDNDSEGQDAMALLKGILPTATLIDVSLAGQKPESWDVADAVTEGWSRGQIEAFISGNSSSNSEPSPCVPADPIEPPRALAPLVEWIQQAATSAQKHYAIQGAFMLLSAISQGAYSAPTTSVSLYSILVGGAGAGKNRIVDVVADAVWDLGLQWLSTGEAGSKQAIRSMLHRCNARMIVHGELGNRIADWQASGGIDKAIGTEILELWAEKPRLEGLQTKETIDPTIERPRLGIFGGVTTSAFREMIGRNRFIEKGWPSRVQFVFAQDVEKLEVVERPKGLEGELLKRLKRIAEKSTKEITKIDCTSPDATVRIKEIVKVRFSSESSELLKRYQKFCSKREKSYEKAGQNAEHIVSRCAERAQRIASLLAIFSDPDSPVISEENMSFSIRWEEFISAAFYDEAVQHGDNSLHERCAVSIIGVMKNKDGKLTKREIKRTSRVLRSVTPEVEKSVYERLESYGTLKVDKVGKAHVVTLLSDDYQSQKITWNDT